MCEKNGRISNLPLTIALKILYKATWKKISYKQIIKQGCNGKPTANKCKHYVDRRLNEDELGGAI